jgi:mono/diheme cytochrome c family protein
LDGRAHGRFARQEVGVPVGAPSWLRAALIAGVLSTPLATAVHAQRPTGAPLSAFASAKAEQLLRTKTSCLGCHQLRGEGGVLGPSLDAVRERRDPGYIAAIISDPQHTKPGASMPRVRMPASERLLLVRYLGGDPSQIRPTPAPLPAAPADGKALYTQWCAGCHGATGNGNGPNAAYLPVRPAQHNNTTAMSARSDDALFDTIEAGGAIMNKSPRMPAFGGSLTSQQIRALVQYIRTMCRCQAPAWSRDGGPS